VIKNLKRAGKFFLIYLCVTVPELWQWPRKTTAK